MLSGEEIVNAVADAILFEFFPYPNPRNIHVQNAVDFMMRVEFLAYCSEENRARIKNLSEYCENYRG